MGGVYAGREIMVSCSLSFRGAESDGPAESRETVKPRPLVLLSGAARRSQPGQRALADMSCQEEADKRSTVKNLFDLRSPEPQPPGGGSPH